MNPTSIQLRSQILSELRHGPINPYELADTLDQAPFRIRGELKAMKRDRLVREHLTPKHVWELTPKGERHAWGAEQQELAR